MAHDASWQKIFDDFKILEHDFEKGPYVLMGQNIKIPSSINYSIHSVNGV